MQVIGKTPTFNGCAPFTDGTVTSIGEIKDWYAKHTEDYEAYVYDGKKHELSSYKEPEVVEDEPTENVSVEE